MDRDIRKRRNYYRKRYQKNWIFAKRAAQKQNHENKAADIEENDNFLMLNTKFKIFESKFPESFSADTNVC